MDDNRDNADSLQLVLTVFGHESHAVYGGEEAIVAASEFRPDAILLDIGMPRLTGYEVCRRIRQEPWGKDIHIIAQTGWGEKHARQQSQEAGFDHHFVKPIDMGILFNLLSSLLMK